MKKCLQCGQELVNEAKFCFNCGSKVEENSNTVSVGLQPTAQRIKVKSYSELFEEWKNKDGYKYYLTNIFFKVINILVEIGALLLFAGIFYFTIKSEIFEWKLLFLFVAIGVIVLISFMGQFLYMIKTCFFITMKPSIADWLKERNVNPVRLVHDYLKDKKQDKVFVNEIFDKTEVTKDFEVNEKNFVQASYLINVEAERKHHYKKHIFANITSAIEMVTFLSAVFVLVFDVIPDAELTFVYYIPVIVCYIAVNVFKFIYNNKRVEQEVKEREIWLKNNIYNKSDEEIAALYELEENAINGTDKNVEEKNQNFQTESVCEVVKNTGNSESVPDGKKKKSKITAVLLCTFLGPLGVHRFYEGKIGTGILWLCTFGLLGVGALVDWFTLLFKPNPYYV